MDSVGLTEANPYGIDLYTATSPTGAEIHLQAQEEADWYEAQKQLYLSHNRFTNASDLNDLERLLTLEVMVYRWSRWLTRGFDYVYNVVSPQALKSNIREWSTEIRLLKQSLGIDKATREKDRGEDLAEYIQNLLRRAKEFGYHRNQQYELAVTKLYQLRSLVLTHDRCDEEERRELDLSPESIIEWIRSDVVPAWDELEASFRKTQSVWIREL